MNVELLSPAGDMECLDAALRYGADAVYIGGSMLQLRAQSAGFDREAIVHAAEKVHAQSKKLYVTVNSFAKDQEFKEIVEYGRKLKDVLLQKKR